MKIKTADFITSAYSLEQFPQTRLPEIAFAGRSNVGKSTLLNTLLNKKGLAKTSKKPGKTRAANFFDINGRAYFVDLPGYGFAQAPKALRDEWGQVITDYLTKREPLRLVVHLVDMRHTPTLRDQQLLDLLDEAQKPALIVATKSDKLRPSERAGALDELRSGLGLEQDALIVPFSAINKEGLRELWGVIDDVLRG